MLLHSRNLNERCSLPILTKACSKSSWKPTASPKPNLCPGKTSPSKLGDGRLMFISIWYLSGKVSHEVIGRDWKSTLGEWPWRYGCLENNLITHNFKNLVTLKLKSPDDSVLFVESFHMENHSARIGPDRFTKPF